MDRDMLVKTYLACVHGIPMSPVTMCVDGEWLTWARICRSVSR